MITSKSNMQEQCKYNLRVGRREQGSANDQSESIDRYSSMIKSFVNNLIGKNFTLNNI